MPSASNRRRRLEVAQSVAIVVLAACVVVLFVQRGTARSYYNDQIKKLACTLVQRTPPGDVLGDELRAEHHCPPYQQRQSPRAAAAPPTSRAPSPKHATTPQAGRTAPRQSAASTSPAAAPARARRTSVAPPTGRATHRQQPPGSAPRPTSAPPPPGSSTTPATPLLPLPGCTLSLLGIRVC